MIQSARTRVTLRYTLFFALVVLTVAGGIYGLLQENAYARLDESLQSTLEVMTLALFHETQEHGGKAGGEEELRKVLNTMYQTSFPQEQVVIREGARLVAYKVNLGKHQSDLRQAPLSLLSKSHSPLNALDLRIATKRVFVPEAHTLYTVSVSTWRGDVQNDMASLCRALAITIPLSLLLAGVGGYLLSKRTLAPLTTMTATVDEITSSHLDKRVPVANPKDELGQLATCFNRLLQRLQDAFLQQQRFMADASHELRTPVAAALTAAQVTLHGPGRSAKELRQALQMVEEQMLRLRRIVQDLFLLAQADAHVLTGRWEKIYLDDIIAEGCRALRFLTEAKEIRLQVAELPELPCLGDADLLRQALMILLDNAQKYTFPGGTIQVSVQATATHYVIRVADTGPGIPEAAQAHIFERFYRVEKSRSRLAWDGGGAGLGLAIARWIADLHHGKLLLEASSPSGSVFTLAIPRVLFRDSALERAPSQAAFSDVGTNAT